MGFYRLDSFDYEKKEESVTRPLKYLSEEGSSEDGYDSCCLRKWPKAGLVSAGSIKRSKAKIKSI